MNTNEAEVVKTFERMIVAKMQKVYDDPKESGATSAVRLGVGDMEPDIVTPTDWWMGLSLGGARICDEMGQILVDVSKVDRDDKKTWRLALIRREEINGPVRVITWLEDLGGTQPAIKVTIDLEEFLNFLETEKTQIEAENRR